MISPNGNGLSCRDLSVSVPHRTLVRELELHAAAGSFIAVLGRNGAGKSLTLHTLAGLREPDGGSVCLDESDIGQWQRVSVARRLALLPQYTEDIFPATALDTVMIGRHPHIDRFSWETEEDRKIASHALAEMDLADMPDRDVLTLSGGERRRLAIAQILAQTPEIFLLDEPTNHLDPQHQMQVLELFRYKANEGSAVVASLHDVNLAARFADHCLLLFGDGRWEFGETASVLNEECLSDLYATPMESVHWRGRELFVALGA